VNGNEKGAPSVRKVLMLPHTMLVCAVVASYLANWGSAPYSLSRKWRTSSPVLTSQLQHSCVRLFIRGETPARQIYLVIFDQRTNLKLVKLRYSEPHG
jgi:hypothetical protein